MKKNIKCCICQENIFSNSKSGLMGDISYHLSSKHPEEYSRWIDDRNQYLHDVNEIKQVLRTKALKLVDNPELILPNYSGNI